MMFTWKSDVQMNELIISKWMVCKWVKNDGKMNEWSANEWIMCKWMNDM